MLRVLTPTTRISGKIITPFKDPEAGVKVRLAGTASAETTTAQDGICVRGHAGHLHRHPRAGQLP